VPNLHHLKKLLPALGLLYSVNAFSLPSTPSQRPAGEYPARENVRVRLGQFSRLLLTGVDLALNGGAPLEGSSNFSLRCGSGPSGKAEIFHGLENLGREFLVISSRSGFLQLNGKLYRGSLTIFPRGQECVVINTVQLEKYLAGLINKEMAPSWPLEALKAQAVASRSYALFQAQVNQNREYDLESSVMDQVYDGAGSETARSNQAVNSTRGIVVTYAKVPVKAYFHANCGGMTELPVSVWGQDSPAFRPVICPFHKKPRDKTSWTLKLTNSQIEAALRKTAGLLPHGFLRLARLEAGAPNPNQRLSDLIVSDRSGNSLVIPATAFRNAIGNQKLKSTAFSIQAGKDGYRIVGEGFGHGVGMCQVGARAMAEQGKTFSQILKYYYPLGKITRL
jgi:stage II sporulation protein D